MAFVVLLLVLTVIVFAFRRMEKARTDQAGRS
jgi:multiple sugar transport system permease protein